MADADLHVVALEMRLQRTAQILGEMHSGFWAPLKERIEAAKAEPDEMEELDVEF